MSEKVTKVTVGGEPSWKRARKREIREKIETLLCVAINIYVVYLLFFSWLFV